MEHHYHIVKFYLDYAVEMDCLGFPGQGDRYRRMAIELSKACEPPFWNGGRRAWSEIKA